MEYKKLGKTGIEVSRLCLGTLTMTKSQADLGRKKSGELIEFAYERGINFLDTAELYDNYDLIKEGLKLVGRKNLIITSKTYAYTKEMADESVKKYLKELNTDYADIFLLHEQESELTLKGHYEALEELFRLKEKGYIKAVGISTHKIAAVKAALKFDEIEIIHPMINKKGMGILDGTRDEMMEAIKNAHKKGIGIYGMKVLGGGHLIEDFEDAIRWAANNEYLDSIAIGMQSEEEVIANCNLVEGSEVPEKVKSFLRKNNRQIAVEEYCIGCGRCKEVCKANAIQIIDDHAVIDDNCILCGYCANACPDFYIKVY